MKARYLFSRPDVPPSQVFTPDGHRWEWGDPVDLAIIGQSPSTKRPLARRYEVFGGRSWSLLRQLLTSWVDGKGLTVFVTNAIRQPLEPRSRVSPKLLDLWSPLLEAELEQFRPRLILAVGAYSAKMLAGERFHKMAEDHGASFPLALGRQDHTARVVPTFHFSTTYDDLTTRRFLTNDLERFETLIGGDREGIPAPAYFLHEGSLPEPLMALLARHTSQLILDIETTGLDPTAGQKMLFIGLRFAGENHLIKDPDPEWAARLGRLLCQDRRIALIGHNLYFDLHWLCHYAGPWWGRVPHVVDTMLMALIAGEPVLSLKHLTSLHTSLNSSHAFGGPTDPSYLAMDLIATEAIHDVMAPRVRDSYALSLLNDLVPHLVDARYNGVRIQTDKLAEIGEQLKTQMEVELATFPFNPSSDKQLVEWLTAQGRSTGLKTPKGAMSVSAEALDQLIGDDRVGEMVQSVVDYRALRKVASGFVDNYTRLMDTNGYLHPRLLLHGARTGRLSSSDPNVQQVPRRGPIKTLFISRFPGGYLGLVDLSQAELRCAALLSNDYAMMESLLTADPHRHNAARLYKKPVDEVTAVERKKSKAITFGLLYRGSPEGLASRTGFHINEIREALALFSQAFPTLMSWLAEVEAQGMKTLAITTLLGRHRELESVLTAEGERGVRRKCANTHIQSLANDINLMIARRVMEQLRCQGLRSKFMFTVHDSTILDIHPDEVSQVAAIVQEAYRSFAHGSPLETLPLWGQLPIIGELIIGPTWASIESTNEGYDPLISFPCSSEVIDAIS